MKAILNKLMLPCSILLLINAIGYIYHQNYNAAVAGSIIGMMIGVIINEIKIKL